MAMDRLPSCRFRDAPFPDEPLEANLNPAHRGLLGLPLGSLTGDHGISCSWGLAFRCLRLRRGAWAHQGEGSDKGRVREDSAKGSGPPNHEPTNRNRIRGVADQGERAFDREALATKGRRVNPAAVWGTSMKPYLGRSRLFR